MVVNVFLLLLVGSYGALSYQDSSLELNLLNNPAAYSSELNFSNSRVFAHDVKPNFIVERVTQSGLTVWKSPEAGHRVTNATLVFNDLGPRFVYLAVFTPTGKSELLYYIYTLNGWVNLNDVHPFNIVLDRNDSFDKKLSLPVKDKQQGKAKEESKEEGSKDEQLQPVDLDIENGPIEKFDYRFSYNQDKFTYYYKPRSGYYVRSVRDGKTVMWKVRDGQVLAYVNAEKQNGSYVSTSVTYLEGNSVYVDLFNKENSEWKFTSTTKTLPPSLPEPSKNQVTDSQEVSEVMKPVDRLTVFDFSNIPEPPACRKCTYNVNGVVHNVVYVNSTSNVRLVVDGATTIYEVPRNIKFDHACYYTKNDKVVFVDIMVREPGKSMFIYFEKVDGGYEQISRQEFEKKLNSLMEFDVVLDISDQKEGYNVVTYVKGALEYNVFTPKDRYIVKRVSDGKQPIISFETDVRILQVTVDIFDTEKKLLSVFYHNGSVFSYEYFTYFKEMSKWTRVSDHFYFKLLDEFSKEVPHKYPSLDITLFKLNNKYVDINNHPSGDYFSFIPKPGVVLGSVFDSGRMVWTPRFPNEVCTYVWYQPKFKLMYVISKDANKVRSYRYEKSENKWYFLNEDEFKLRFSFYYSKNLTANIREDLPEQFDVVENDNMFTIKPQHGYLVNRIRYGDRVIWVGSDNLKCTSFNVIFGWHDTYLYLNLLDSEFRNQVKYYRTIDGDILKWKSCSSFFDDCDCNDSDCLSNHDLTKGSFGVDVQKLLAEKKAQECKDDKETKEAKEKTDKESSSNEVEDENKKTSVDSEEETKANGDLLVVTNVDRSEKEPTPTNLSTDTTQVINGIPVTPNSTLQFTPGVFDESRMSTLEYLKPKKQPLKAIEYPTKMPLTVEPHNPDKVPVYSDEELNQEFYDASDKDFDESKAFNKLSKPVEAATGLESTLGNEQEKNDHSSSEKEKKDNNKNDEKKAAPKTSYNLPSKLVYPKHTDPSGRFYGVHNSSRSKPKTNKPSGSEKTDSSNKTKPESFTTTDDFIYPEETNSESKDLLNKDDSNNSKNKNTLTTPEDFIYPDDSKTESSDLSKSETKVNSNSNSNSNSENKSESLTTPKDFESDMYSNVRNENFNESDNNSEKSSLTQNKVQQEKPVEEKQFTGFGQGKIGYLNGLLYLQGLRSAGFGEFRDCRPQGFNYLLFTPKPGLPIKQLKDGFETIWSSDTDEGLALSVFLKNGFPQMLELFVKCSTKVRRKHYEMVQDKWHEITPERYESLTNSS